MKTSKARQPWFRQMLTAALMLLLVLGVATPASAEYVPKELDQIVLSNFVIKTQDGKLPLPDDLHLGNRIRLTMDWSATPQYDYQLHAGDYFQFTLSPKLFVTAFPQNINFDLMDPSGEIVVAKGHIAKTGSGNPGPTVTVTFTNYVEGKADIKGSLYVVADFVQAPGNEGDQNTYDITYGDSIITSQHIKVGKVPVSNVSEEAVRKWSGIATEKVDGVTVSVPDKVRWAVRVNMQKKSMKNVVLNDQMRTVEGNTPLVIFDNSFELRSYLYLLDPDTGAIAGNPVFTSIVALPKDDPRLTMNATGDGFEFRLGNTQTFAEAFPAEAAKPDNVPYADHYLTYILYFTSTCDPDERAYNDGTATYDEGVEKTFSSSYLAVGGGGGGSGAFASFTATKRWAGGPLDDRDKAELVLLQEGNPFTPPSGSLKITKVNDTNYTYTWSQLPVTNPTTGDKYTYSAREAGVTEGHVEIGGRLYAVLEDGKLITNTFVVPQIEVTATKLWVGGPAADHEPVAITLLRDGVALDPQPVVKITPAAGPADSFGYVWEDLPATDDDGKAYTYSVEEAGAKAGTRVVNGNTYAVSQAVDNTITNTYQKPEPAKLAIALKKELTGAELAADAFTFHLYGTDLTTPLQSGTNALDGSLSFALQFDAEGDYVLHVKEKDAGAEGMAYDASQYKLTYRVQMGEGNKLVAELTALEKNGEPIEKVLPLIFRNSFTPSTPEPTPEPTAEPTPEPTAEPTPEPTPEPTFTPAPTATQEPQPPDPTYPAIKVPLSARKTLQNGSLKAGVYVFQLKDSAGKVLATVSNDADGRIAFPDRSFSRVVTNYRYTIHEVAGEDSRIVYDQTVYTVKVSTKAVGGELQATVDIERNGTPYAGEMTFTNTQKAPPTGDQQYHLMLMLVVSSLALASVAILMRVRRQRSE